MVFAEHASASEPFPPTIREEWKVSNLGVPGAGCLLCHLTDPGLPTNIQQKFGRTVKDVYEVPLRNTSALKSALRKMRADRSDSDRDGITDYDELVNGTNVNVADVLEPPPDPSSGGAGDGGAQGTPDPTPGGLGAGVGGSSATPPPPVAPTPDTALPVPETGCSVAPRSVGRSSAFVLALLALSSLLGFRRRFH